MLGGTPMALLGKEILFGSLSFYFERGWGGVKAAYHGLFHTLQKWHLCALGTTFFIESRAFCNSTIVGYGP